MSKKTFITILTILTFAFSFTYVFAANSAKNVVNDVRNVVGGAENTVEDAAKDVTNASKNITGGLENDAKDVTDNNKNSNNMEDQDKQDTYMDNSLSRTEDHVENTAYAATRTSTDNPTLMGMSSTAWTWLILGIAAIAIIALVWYYSMQLTGNNYDNGNDD